jgi:hypothetical protein
MGLLRTMVATQVPSSGKPLGSPGSQLVTFDSDFINWPTLASVPGTTASSTFMYGAATLAANNTTVKLSVASVRSAFGAIQA